MSMRGSVFSLRSDVHPTPFRPRAASLSRPPPLGMCTGWGLPVSVRGSEVCARGARHAHAGVGEEELSAQDCAPGPGPRYSDLCDVKKCQQGGRTTHHLQMTTPSCEKLTRACEKLTRADREPRGEHRMPPTWHSADLAGAEGSMAVERFILISMPLYTGADLPKERPSRGTQAIPSREEWARTEHRGSVTITTPDGREMLPRNRCTDLDGASFAHGLLVQVSVES